MGKPKRRDKRKKAKPMSGKAGPKMGLAWTRLWAKSQGGHPNYGLDNPSLAFARRAVGMALSASKNKRLVDIGAGRGEITSPILRVGGHVTLVDPAKVSALSQKMPFERITAYAEKLPREWTGKFGTALLAYSLSYARKNKRQALAEVRRVLDDNGRLIALIHHPKSIYLRDSKLGEQVGKATLRLLEGVRRKRIKTYKAAVKELGKIAEMTGASQTNIELVNRFLHSYFEGKKSDMKAGIRAKFWDQKIKENIERVKIQEASFGPLHEPGNLFPNKGAVRGFFENNGFRVRFLRELKKGDDIYCYAVYAQKKGGK